MGGVKKRIERIEKREIKEMKRIEKEIKTRNDAMKEKR
tara:strand:- start:187 stop:300 length:114 start_codon:yes stop_codon:yes gene_type:complete